MGWRWGIYYIIHHYTYNDYLYSSLAQRPPGELLHYSTSLSFSLGVGIGTGKFFIKKLLGRDRGGLSVWFGTRTHAFVSGSFCFWDYLVLHSSFHRRFFFLIWGLGGLQVLSILV